MIDKTGLKLFISTGLSSLIVGLLFFLVDPLLIGWVPIIILLTTGFILCLVPSIVYIIQNWKMSKPLETNIFIDISNPVKLKAPEICPKCGRRLKLVPICPHCGYKIED